MQAGTLVKTIVFFVALVSTSIGTAQTAGSKTFSTWVGADGTISLPLNFRRTFTFLGAWSNANTSEDDAAPAGGAAGLHNVYIQPDAIDAYNETGQFPDGTMIIKELLKTTTGPLTTGTVSWGEEVEEWFIMVKDRHSRFKDNPLWGDGWGWVLLSAGTEAGAAKTSTTKSYQAECLGCHVPARENDWIYVEGYPLLNP